MHSETTHRRHPLASTSTTSSPLFATNDDIEASFKPHRGTAGKAKKIRRKRRGGGKGTSNPNRFLCYALCVAVTLLGAWILVLWTFQPNSKNQNHKNFKKDPADAVKKESLAAVVEPVVESNERITSVNEKEEKTSEWEGWQPSIPTEMEITWPKCIINPNKYSSCRDLESDMGTPPPPPPDWIPDVKMLRRMFLKGQDNNGNPWPPPLDDEELCGKIGPQGGTHQDTNKELIEIVPIIAQPMDRTEEQARKEGLSNNKPLPPPDRPMPKIMCSLYTMKNAHAGSIRAIRETWGGGCDGFLAFSTESDPRIPAISIPHDGPEEYDNMWQKLRSIHRFVATHYLDDFDWFFVGGDDLYVLPQNLREYLWTVGDAEEDHFIGRRFLPLNHGSFNSGGSGYALSRSTLRKFLAVMEDKKCRPTRHTAQEDVMIARCLQDIYNIVYYDTRDEEDRERFHPFAPGHHYTWRPPGPSDSGDWYEQYNEEWGVKLGKDCCAPDSVSFHYIKKPTMVRHLTSLLYGCGNGKGMKVEEGSGGDGNGGIGTLR